MRKSEGGEAERGRMKEKKVPECTDEVLTSGGGGWLGIGRKKKK